jgi:hypothetical protein
MRSTFAIAALLASACAVGGASDDSVLEDAGGTKDVSQQKDVSTIGDTGTPFDSGSTQDVNQPPQDSGNTGCTFSGVLATYDFTGALGSQTSTVAKSSAANVTAGAVARATGLTATAGANSINSSNWSTAANVDTSKYYTFSLTPKNGCSLDVTSLSITTQASSTGPTKAAVATSDDKFTAMTSIAPNTAASPSLSVNGATGAVEVRVYGWAASGTGGTMRLDTSFTVSGALH